MMSEKTTFDLTDWTVIAPKTADLFFTESSKRLQSSIDNFRNSKQVAHRLLGIVLPLIAVAVGYVYSKPEYLTWPVIAFVALEAAGLWFIVRSMYSQTFQPVGAMPVDLFRDDMFIKGQKEDLQYLGALLNHCENMQDKISQNEAANKFLTRNVNIALTLCAVAAPAVFVMFSLVAFCR